MSVCLVWFWLFLSGHQVEAQTSPLIIASPSMNTVVAPGDNVTVSVTRATGSDITDVALYAFGWSDVASGSDPLTFTIAIPPNTQPGPLQVLAFDVTLRQTPGIAALSQPLVLIVESPRTFTTLATNLAALHLQFVGDEASLTATGLVPGGTPVVLNGSSRISFISQNNAVATVDPSGVVKATAPGNTSIVVTYANPDGSTATATVPVSVPTLIRGDLNGDGSVDSEDLQILFLSFGSVDSVPGDARDLNLDGVIDGLDAEVLVSLCTRSGCTKASNSIAPTIAWPTPNGITYGTALSGAQLNATASVPGTFLYSPPAGSVLGAGSRPLFVAFNPLDATRYITAVATVTLAISRAPATVTLDSASLNQTYDGTPKSATAKTVPAGLALSFTYNGSGTPPSNPGVYAVVATISDANYLGSVTGTLTIIKLPPITDSSLSGLRGKNGWYTGPVTVTLTVTDSGGPSDVASTSYVVDSGSRISYTAPFTVSADGIHIIQFGSVDKFGNAETLKTTTIKIDQTPPLINCGAPDGLWHASNTSINCTASDVVSGLANPPDASFSLSTNVHAGTETSNASTGTRSVCDVAGNCATAGPIMGNMVDEKPPTIAVSSPTAGGSYLLNQPVNANYMCTDGGSGVATCTGTVASGSPVATASVGTKTFTVSATDKVGNVAPTQTVSYSVTYGICLLYDPTRAVLSGSTLPLKIQLCDSNNTDVSTSTVVVHAVSLVQTSTNASEVLQASGNANPNNNFRFDPTLSPTGGYIFNLSTQGLTTGSYQLTFTAAGDPLPHVLSFQVM